MAFCYKNGRSFGSSTCTTAPQCRPWTSWWSALLVSSQRGQKKWVLEGQNLRKLLFIALSRMDMFKWKQIFLLQLGWWWKTPRDLGLLPQFVLRHQQWYPHCFCNISTNTEKTNAISELLWKQSFLRKGLRDLQRCVNHGLGTTGRLLLEGNTRKESRGRPSRRETPLDATFPDLFHFSGYFITTFCKVYDQWINS